MAREPMRLSRLDLTRYGKFTDRAIDFGPAAPGKPDLHIVYGPNEAGKSTMLSALLDLLFGIESRSRYNFLHPYAAMRIGARLDLHDGTRELRRVKTKQNSLLDGDGRPVDERLAFAELSGIDRDAYRTMFSLDDDTLAEGGESILKSQGDLGQLLFSASAGLVGLSETLAAIQANAAAFYRKGAHGGELASLKARVAELQKSRDVLDTAALAYGALVKERDAATARYEDGARELARARARAAELQRLLGALPRLAEARRIEQALAPLHDLPRPPSGWKEALPGLHAETIALATRRDGIEREIAAFRAAREAIVVDAAALAAEARLKALNDLEARHRTADKDLPERRMRAREHGAAIGGILRRLDRGDDPKPERLLLGAAALGRLRALMETHSGLEAARVAAEAEERGARERKEAAVAALGAARGEGSEEPAASAHHEATALGLAIAAAKGDDHATRRKLAERALADAAPRLAERLTALAPFEGGADALEGMVLPVAADLAQWREARATNMAAIDRHDEAINAATAERERASAERAALAADLGLSGDEGVADLRALRKAAWARHRQRLDMATATDFETALEREEAVTDARIARAGDAARLRETERTLARASADFAEARRRRDDAGARLAPIDRAIAAALDPLRRHMAQPVTLAWVEAWMPRREKAIESLVASRQAARDLASARADGDAARVRLRAALGPGLDADSSFADLLAEAEARRDGIARLVELKRAVETLSGEHAARTQALESATAALDAWNASWRAACAGCWLGESGQRLSLGQVRESLATLQALEPKLIARENLDERIAKMEADRTAFTADITALAEAVGESADGRGALAIAEAIRSRVAGAISQSARDAEIEASIVGAEDRLSDVLAAETALGRRATEMTAFFGAQNLTEVATKLDDAARRAELTERLDEARRDVLAAARLPAFEEAEAALMGIDPTALECEQAELATRMEDQDDRLRELYTARAKADDRIEAIGGDDAIARIEAERRAQLLEIEDKAARALRLRAGALAAGEALRLYRDRHQSSMLTRASEAFRTISRGAYSGLVSQPDDKAEILLAVRSGGGSLKAPELSKGTCFQLYLALRVAGHHEFAKARRPAPFIADDIMETFDDFRAEEAFRLFGEMALSGQVIYLTHHNHLCEIARRVCPDATVHRLDQPDTAVA